LSSEALKISAIILSGGRATRMGGVDKGLVILKKKPLIEHVIMRLTPQVDEILINANREVYTYQALGYPVLKDENDGFIGPLAGFLLGLKYAKHDYVVTVPCDSPFLPLDLVQRLYMGMTETNADVVVALSNGDTHPVFCLMKKSVLPSLQAFINRGERKVSAWQKSLYYTEVDFSACALNNCTSAFTNLNTFDDLKALELKT
jgi:molybdopterin-guanine dinucleotide biosynthesis protein A